MKYISAIMRLLKGFNVLMLNVCYDVIALCETCLNDGHTDEMLNLVNYKIFILDRASGDIRNSKNKLKRGGGLVIYVHDKYSKYVTILNDCSRISYNLEYIYGYKLRSPMYVNV